MTGALPPKLFPYCVALLWMAGLPATTGCGGKTGPKISESAQQLIDAREAITKGDTAAALVALDASIASEPNLWAYVERAKLNAQQGADDAVLADCQEIIKLDPENRDVPWIQGELKKPREKRFTGGAEAAPSSSK